MSTLFSWRELSEPQIEEVLTFFLEESSYTVLAATFPYSLTELLSEIRRNNSGHDDYVFVDHTQKIQALLRLSQWDERSQTLCWMMGIRQIENSESLSTSFMALQAKIRKKIPKIRFFSYVFEHEPVVKGVLKTLGFQQEAIIGDHIWANGTYIGLEIWGTRRLGC